MSRLVLNQSRDRPAEGRSACVPVLVHALYRHVNGSSDPPSHPGYRHAPLPGIDLQGGAPAEPRVDPILNRESLYVESADLFPLPWVVRADPHHKDRGVPPCEQGSTGRQAQSRY